MFVPNDEQLNTHSFMDVIIVCPIHLFQPKKKKKSNTSKRPCHVFPPTLKSKLPYFVCIPKKKPLIMSFTLVIPPYSLLGLSKSCLVAYLFFGDEIFTYHCPWHDFLKLASRGYSNYLGSSPFINPLGTSFFWIIRCLMQNSFLLLKKRN